MRALRSVPAEPRPETTADRLRALIGCRDTLACALADVDAEIATASRAFADERGEFMRPGLDDLRRRLMSGAR